jgi:hypothetical protein
MPLHVHDQVDFKWVQGRVCLQGPRIKDSDDILATDESMKTALLKEEICHV